MAQAKATWRFQADDADTLVDIENSGLGHLIQYDPVHEYVSNPLSFIVIQTHNRTSATNQCVIKNEEGDKETETSSVMVQSKCLCSVLYCQKYFTYYLLFY